MGGKLWTQEELNYIAENYETKTCRDIANFLGRSEVSVQLISHRKGLNIRNGIRPDFALKEDEPKYGKLKIIRKFVEEGTTKVECICDCGSNCIRNYKSLTDGITDDCGCDRGELNKTHGLYKHKLYHHFHHMKARCYNSNCKEFHHYGGRGISICEEWLNDFKSFYDWSISNGWYENCNLTIDRKDTNGNYEPDNCRWATAIVQGNNRRNNKHLDIFGERKTIADWSRDSRCKVSIHTLRTRLRDGWEPEKALTTPTKSK